MTLTTCFKSTKIFCTARLPSFLIAKEIKNQFLRKLLPLLFTSLLFVNQVFPQFLQARQSVGLLSVDVKYPSKGLNWLGLNWDERIVFQSTNQSRHREMAYHLLESGLAYKCFSTPEELAEMRSRARITGGQQGYD